MDSNDGLSPEVVITYDRAYELASQLAPSSQDRVALGYRTNLPEDWLLNSILVQVLRRLDGGNRADPGIAFMAIRDVLNNRRSVTVGLSNSGPV